MGMSDRPDSDVRKIRGLETPTVVTRYSELKQVVMDLLKTMSVATDPSLQYFALRSLLSIAVSVLDSGKHKDLVSKCKEALAYEIEIPSVDLRYEMHPNNPREIYTFQINEKTVKVSSEVFVPTFQIIERFLYRQHYIRYAGLVIEVLKVLVEEGKIPWEMKYSFKLASVDAGVLMSSPGKISIFEERPELGEEDVEEEEEEEIEGGETDVG